MEIEENKEERTYSVSINHCIVISKENPFFNFRQYVENMLKEFDAKMSQTLHQVILETSK